MLRDCRLHLQDYKKSALAISYTNLGCVFVITVLNVLVAGFDPLIATF